MLARADLMDAQAKLMSAHAKTREIPLRAAEMETEARNQMAERESREKIERMILEKERLSDIMDIEKERFAAQVRAAEANRRGS
jgi:hypothetical protein